MPRRVRRTVTKKWGPEGRHGVEASHKAKGKPNPKVKSEVVDASPVPTAAERTLTPDDLRTFANSMAAMTAEPTMSDRSPDDELPQHRTKLTAVAKPSLLDTRTIIMMIGMFMMLLAVLIEVNRRSLSER